MPVEIEVCRLFDGLVAGPAWYIRDDPRLGKSFEATNSAVVKEEDGVKLAESKASKAFTLFL